MSWGFWKPYVPAAQRRANAKKEAARFAKNGRTLAPVCLEGRKIASSFWGKAWCNNLESYSDYANRLPRGRTYVRNGSVIDLQITEGRIAALVSGSSIYKIEIKIKPLAEKLWSRVKADCSGRIDSLIELLQGKLSASVMEVVTHPDNGLFPKPGEISMDCSCPDWAGLCKHLAACLYGIGARLDQSPELLFTLRGVNPGELISAAASAEAMEQVSGKSSEAMSDGDLSAIFGIEIDSESQAPAVAEPASKKRKSSQKGARLKTSTPSKPVRNRRASPRPERPTRPTRKKIYDK